MNLEELALKYGSDKSSLRHNYMIEYEKYFAPIKETTKSILELGVWMGGSLRIWEEYFKNARVHGIDINASCKFLESKRGKIFIGDQQDIEFLESVCNETGELDIVIDDCSHAVKDQIVSLGFLYYKLKRGGIYVIEDVEDRDMPVLLASIEVVECKMLSVYKSKYKDYRLIVLKRPE